MKAGQCQENSAAAIYERLRESASDLRTASTRASKRVSKRLFAKGGILPPPTVDALITKDCQPRASQPCRRRYTACFLARGRQGSQPSWSSANGLLTAEAIRESQHTRVEPPRMSVCRRGVICEPGRLRLPPGSVGKWGKHDSASANVTLVFCHSSPQWASVPGQIVRPQRVLDPHPPSHVA